MQTKSRTCRMVRQSRTCYGSSVCRLEARCRPKRNDLVQDYLMPPLINLRSVAIAATLTQFVFGQSPTASLSGRVLSEEGRTLSATVTLNFAAARGYPAPPRRARTDANGNFSFSKLPPGTYKLCAQVATSEAAPANSPYIDTCDWPSGQPPITVAAGQQVTGVMF